MLIMKQLVWLAGKEQYIYQTELRRTEDELNANDAQYQNQPDALSLH